MSDADVWCIIQHCCTWARSDKETGGRRFVIVVHFLPRYHLLGCVTVPFKKQLIVHIYLAHKCKKVSEAIY